MNTQCRRCSECPDNSHHWMPDPMEGCEEDPDFLPGDYACKHCDQRGDECDDCQGMGTPSGEAAGLICGTCNGEGVIPIAPAEYLARILTARWDAWEADAGQLGQQAQDVQVAWARMRELIVSVIEEVYPPAVTSRVGS